MRAYHSCRDRRSGAGSTGASNEEFDVLKGSIDAVQDGKCRGWTRGDDAPESIEVELLVDGRIMASVMADSYCDGLEQAGLRDGHAAFAIEIPDALRDSCHHRIEIRTSDGRMVDAQEAVQVLPKLTPAEFDRRAPWIDADAATCERELAARVQAGLVDAETEARSRFFRTHGWLKLEQAVPHELIDKVLADVEQAWRDLRHHWC